MPGMMYPQLPDTAAGQISNPRQDLLPRFFFFHVTAEERLNIVEDDEVDATETNNNVIDEPLTFGCVERRHVLDIVATDHMQRRRDLARSSGGVGYSRFYQPSGHL